MSTQDKIKEAIALVEEGLASIATDSEWLNFLRFQSLFYQYSYSNAILIYLQNPEATYVKGYKAWNKLGRYVVKGGKGLKILAPCYRKVEVFKEPENKAEYHQLEGEKEVKRVLSGFKITHVFDIADTAGSDEYLPVLVRGLAGNSDDVKELYEKVLAVVSKEYPVKEVFKTASKGSYNLETKQISDNASLLLSQSVTAAPNNKVLIESDFSIYDWVVMEAVATMYAYAEANNKLDNGVVAIDIQSIDKILKRDVLSRMSQETKKNILTSDIVKSFPKMLS